MFFRTEPYCELGQFPKIKLPWIVGAEHFTDRASFLLR